jgi:alpha-ketoglutarate-dependent taurine dioxygenase
MITFTRLSGALGADVHGIDLTQPLTTETAEAIRTGLLDHQVLFFREQKILTFDQHLAMVKHFGEPEPTPFRRPGDDTSIDLLVLDQTDPTGSQAAHFHADNTFRQVPPLGAILQAHVVPAAGGDTCFSSMTAAYEGLSPRMQAYLDGLEAFHSYAQMAERLARQGVTRPGLNLDDHPPVKHPVVARHPETDRQLLFVNYNWTTYIDGIPGDESAAILDFLYEHIKSPEFQVRLRWNRGDVVFWDNRVVQHYAVPDYHERRLLHRLSILPRGHRE